MGYSINITAKHLYSVLCCLLIFSITTLSKAQTNLVPNGSFEQYTTCPVNNRNDKPDYWYKPDYRFAFYLNACANAANIGVPAHGTITGPSFQYAKSGFAYMAMFYRNGGDARNYLQVKLIDSLQQGRNYYCEYFVSLSNPFRIGCNNQSMLFTKTAVYVDTVNSEFLPANPQISNYGNPIIIDTLNWIKVSGIFKAQGGEQYLTLGNFRDNAVTDYTIIQPTGYFGAVYYVDDVSVIPLDSFCLKADAGKDTTIALGDSVFIGSYTNGIDSLKWQIQNTTIDSTRPGFWVKPTVTTSYILQQVVNGCFSADTVVVTVGTVPLKMINYKLLMINEPSLLQGTKQSVENFWTTANEVNVSHFNVQRSTNDKDFITIGKVAAQNKNSNEYRFYDSPPVEGLGVVYYRIESIDFDGKKQYSEIRTLNIKPQTLKGVGISPNPAKTNVTVTSKGIRQIEIFDIMGKKVMVKELNNLDKINIDISKLNKGLFLVRVISADGKIINSKFLVE